MNHLAHAHLAAHGSPSYRAGSVLGDFVKGVIDNAQWPADLACGLRLHRRIDGFTDRHPITMECRERFPASWRRLAGPALDVIWDHFLSRQWDGWHTQPLPDFSERTCVDLLQFLPVLPARANAFCHWLKQERILESYQSTAGVEQALALMVHRLPHSAGIAPVTRGWLEEHHDWLETRFRLLYADTLATAQQPAL